MSDKKEKKKKQEQEQEEEPDYTPPPYNYCDYRCERCEHQKTCKVFRDDMDRLLDHYTKGEDPYDPDVFMKDIHDIFDRTKEMVMGMAEEQGIDLSDVSDVEMPRVDPEEYVVYRLAFEYSRTAHGLIKQLEHEGFPEDMREAYSDFVWYHTLIAAKTGRLVSGFIDDDIRDEEYKRMEEQGTLGVIDKGIRLSKDALEVLLNDLPEHLHTIADLTDLIKRLEKQLHTDMRLKVGKETD